MNLCIHYGFGDYVVCYGLVRELAKHEDINLFAIQHRSALHIENIRRLYSNVPNVTIDTSSPGKDVVYIGWSALFTALEKDPSIRNQEFFYNQAGVQINLLWDNFYFERDHERECDVYYNKFGLKNNEPFIFLHDDPERNLVIKSKYINSGMKVIRLIEHQDVSVLDVLFTIEQAREVHIINTGLLAFVDQMKIKHDNLFYHRYVRPLPFEQPILKMNWKIID